MLECQIDTVLSENMLFMIIQSIYFYIYSRGVIDESQVSHIPQNRSTIISEFFNINAAVFY